MRNNIKYSASFIIILLLVIGFNVYAQDDSSVGVTVESKIEVEIEDDENDDAPVACTMDAKVCPDGSSVGRIGPKCEFAKCPNELREVRGDIKVKVGEIRKDIQENREENKEKRDEFRTQVEGVKGEVKTLRDENKVKLDAMISGVKEKRDAFKVEIEAKKVEVKAKADEMRAKFKESLAKVKDENKQTIAINISDTLASLNVKLTTELSLKVDQIENVLVSIQSRITKAEGNGIDVTTAKAQVEKAKTAIDGARTAITTQTGKTYETTITSEATLKAQMKTLRDSFKKDMKIVNDAVKQAHIAVKTVATTLAKIPKIDEEISVTTETNTTVEDNNTNNQ